MVVAWLLAATLGAPDTGIADRTWFRDAARSSGLEFEHVRGLPPSYLFPEIMSGGAAWLDYDGDGDLDLYLVQGGDLQAPRDQVPRNRLYRNDGARFLDVTEAAGVGDPGYGMGAAVGDVDGDGDLDLYVTNVGPNVLYRNQGDGHFIDATAGSGTGDAGWGASAAFLDYDADGDRDLFLVNYVAWSPGNDIECFGAGGRRDYCHPDDYQAPAADHLYRNEGQGVFTDVSLQSGVASAVGNGLGIALADFDLDGWLDVYVANDGMPNRLWRNLGDGTFRDEAVARGCAVNMSGAAEAGMGVAAVDVDQDGAVDLFMTHLRQETNTLYLNRREFFDDATIRLGLAAPSIEHTGFGTGFADFDHDGQLDLYVANGGVTRDEERTAGDPFAEPDQVLRGLAGGGFLEIAALDPGTTVASGRAAVLGDYDEDGDVDVVVANNGGPAQLLANTAAGAGHWIAVRFAPPGSEPTGARLVARMAGRELWRQAGRAAGYCSSQDPRVHFGVGAADGVEELRLLPLRGPRLSLRHLATGRQFVIP